MKNRTSGIETKLIHSGEMNPRPLGAVSMPVFQSSTFEYSGEVGYHAIRYIRLNNTPNHVVLSAKLADLENAEAAMVTSSGMAAISTALLTVLNKGDHLLMQKVLYGGTFDFVSKELSLYGIEYDLIDAESPDTWESKLRKNTKAIYVESITNPLMQVADLRSVTHFAKEHGIISMIDNTFTSPVNFRPPEIGFDLSLHSCSKYMNGHNDIVAGAVIGKKELVEKFTHKLGHLGGSLDPHACFLLDRGLKTLALRVRYQNQSALEIAEYLEKQERVINVNYPGLKSSKYCSRAKDLFEGCGGMISFELAGGLDAAEKLIHNLKIPIYAPSLGGVESLIILPSKTSHAGLSDAEKIASGITDGLIRLSVGIENTQDIINDFDSALKII